MALSKYKDGGMNPGLLLAVSGTFLEIVISWSWRARAKCAMNLNVIIV